MKKILCAALIFCLCLCGCLYGCDDGEKDDKKDDVVRYSLVASSIIVKKAYTDFEIALNESDTKEFLSIINNSEWEEGCLKFRGDYRFIIDGRESTLEYYSEKGLFLDLEADKQLFLTEEQKACIELMISIKQ